MLKSETILLIEESFTRIQDNADAVARSFYERLFTLQPSLQPLFSQDLDRQQQKLLKALTLVVKNLSCLPAVLPVLEKMGHRHVTYGVKNAHYEIVGQALLWALENELGDDFTAATRDGWAQAYTLIADAMKNGASKAERAPEPRTHLTGVHRRCSFVADGPEQLRHSGQMQRSRLPESERFREWLRAAALYI